MSLAHQVVAIRPALSGEIVDRDAVEIGELYERSNSSLADAVIARLECGRRLAVKQGGMKHGKWLRWLEDNAGVLGFESRRTAARLIKAAGANGTLTSHLNETDAVALSRQMWGNTTQRGASGTGENEWYTPPEFLKLARDVLGEIDLDPASSDAAQQQVQAIEYFSSDGLAQDWNGRVWLNPPYAQPHIAKFVSKMVAERQAGRVTDAIMLTHNYTDTAWFHEAGPAADAICFPRGRIKFYDAKGNIAAPTQGQAFFYFGDDVAAFCTVFSAIGLCLLPWTGEV